MSEGDEYLLGMEPQEVERLRRQHEAWETHTRRVWSLMQLARGETVVDLGCGPGFATQDLLQLVGETGKVIGVDASPTAIATLRRRLQPTNPRLETVTADVTDVCIGAWMPDAVFARWLLCFLADPADLIRRLSRHLRPGARVGVMDYGNYLDVRLEPGTGATKRVFVAIYESFSRAGGSLDVAGKLPAVYEANSLAVTAVETLTAVATPGDPLWKWVREFLRLYLPALASSGDLTRGDIDECTAEWDELERTDGTVLYLPPVLGVVGRKVS